MKAGILTLHDSLNYGALLQAYAMGRVYAELGHQAVLVDRRRNPLGWPLKWELARIPARKRMSWFLNATGIWHEWLRRRKTLRFLRRRVGMTPYHFRFWSEAPRDLGVDFVSIGSDQVWNSRLTDPLDCMPGRIPECVPAIAYAASLGRESVPPGQRDDFARCLSKFRRVSVRERETVRALSEIGIASEAVVDPVVLAGRETWDSLIGTPQDSTGHVVVYLLGKRTGEDLAWLRSHLGSCDQTVDVFVGRLVLPPTSGGWPRLAKNRRYWRKLRRTPRLRLHLSAGPEEFLRALASAGAVVTNSYHALVFSALYRKNVRFVTPDASEPQFEMMVRVRDYVGSVVRGPVLQPGLEAAFRSLATDERTETDGDELARRRAVSLEWLKGALRAIGGG